MAISQYACVCVGSRLKKDVEFDLLYARVIKCSIDATESAKCVRCKEFFIKRMRVE